uniref:Uncharacterized protein n=1 Tax=Panagrolaimus sp. JU765 TaxID=591449 RepID=A0AC34QST1_9BILA
MFLFLFFCTILLPTTNAVTFFYGANEANSKSASDLALSNLDQNDVDNLPEVTDNDLYSVFSFCKLLPRLEEMGKVKPKKESREEMQHLARKADVLRNNISHLKIKAEKKKLIYNRMLLIFGQKQSGYMFFFGMMTCSNADVNAGY